MPRLAIQVILYKSSSKLEPLLLSLQAQTYRDFDVWFYENSEDAAEADRTEAQIKAAGLPHHFIRGEKNIGFAGGHQFLYAQNIAPSALLLNDDARLEPDYLQAAVERMESDPSIGSVTGLVYRWDDGEIRRIDTTGLAYRCLGKIVDRFAGERAEDVSREISHAGAVFGVSGAIGLYRRAAVEKAGGLFDPRWFMYKEDADLALRLKQAGFAAWFEPKAIAFHRRGLKEEGSGLAARLAAERKRSAVLREHSYVNQWRIYRKHFRWSLGLNDIVATVLSEIARSALVFLASPRVFFHAWHKIVSL